MAALSATKANVAPRLPKPILIVLPMYRYIFHGRNFPKQYQALTTIFKLFRYINFKQKNKQTKNQKSNYNGQGFQIFNYISGSHSQVFYKKAVLKYFTKFTEKHMYRSLLLIKMQALITLQLYYEKILTQERNLTIFKHAILCSTPSTSFYKACQTQQFFEARQARKHARHAST